MTASPSALTAALSRRGIHYGWAVVAATFLTMMVGASAVGAPGVLIGPLQEEFGWDLADISAAFALRLLLFGAVGPFAAAFLNRFGVRRVSAFALIVAALGVVLLLVRERPADLGLPPFGAAEIQTEPPQEASLARTLLTPIRVLAEASRSATFWILFGTFFICGATTNGLVQTHLIAICGDFGVAPVMAAGLLAAIGAFNFIGVIGSGWLSDRFDSRWLLFWYYALRGLSLFYLPFTGFGFAELTLFAVFYGLDWLATVPPTVKLTAEKFGANATIVFGWIFFGHQIGAAVAAWGAGLTRSFYATYLPAFYAAGFVCLIAAIAVFLIRQPQDGAKAQAA